MCSDCKYCDNAHDASHKKCGCELCGEGEHFESGCCPPDCSCLVSYRHDQRALTEHKYVMGVLELFRDADLFMESLMWGPDGPGGSYRFSAMCSDTFHWASADAETIEPDDFQLLGECLADLRVTPERADYFLCELFAARKRKMRPMPRWISHFAKTPEVRALFEAAGPPRESEFGAP